MILASRTEIVKSLGDRGGGEKYSNLKPSKKRRKRSIDEAHEDYLLTIKPVSAEEGIPSYHVLPGGQKTGGGGSESSNGQHFVRFFRPGILGKEKLEYRS